MPPKKTKGRKRESTEVAEKHLSNSSGEVTDLLSPSEVVKMRKKTRQPAQESIISKEQSNKDKEKEVKNLGKVKSSRVMERNYKKELEKKKEMLKQRKEKSETESENKRSKILNKEKKQSIKKKSKGSDDESGPILYPCGICTKEVSDADDAILCEAGCEYWYHRNCTGMTDIAYQLLTNEDNAEWVCDKCIATKSVPLLKLKGE